MADYDLLSVFPEFSGWVYFDPKKERSLEEFILHGGKWIVYGSKSYVENLYESSKGDVGRDIVAMKYSIEPIKVTPNAPEGKHALLFYCDERRRDEVREVLASKGIKDVVWKNERETMMELLREEPFFYIKLELFHPGRLAYLSKLLNIEINPQLLECAQKIREVIDKTSQEFSRLAESLEHVDK